MILYDSFNVMDTIQQSNSEKRKNSLINYYGLQDGKIKTFAQAANEEHLSVETIRARVNEELRQLRKGSRTKIISKYTYKSISDKIEGKEEEILHIQEMLSTIDSNTIEEIETAEKEHKYDIDIEKLHLSVRSYNCLKRHGINKVKDIEGQNLFTMRNLGKKSVNEIVEVYNSIGLTCKINEEGKFHFLPRDPYAIIKDEEQKERIKAQIEERQRKKEEKEKTYRQTKREQYLANIDELKKEIKNLKEKQQIFEQYIDECRFIVPDKDYVKDELQDNLEVNDKEKQEQSDSETEIETTTETIGNIQKQKNDLQQIDSLIQQISEIDNLFSEISQQTEEEKQKMKQNKLLKRKMQKLQEDAQNIIDKT